MHIKVVDYGSEDYTHIKQLRQDVLRTPIGKILSEKDTAGEENQILIAAFENEKIAASVIFKPLDNGVIKLRQMAVANSHQGQGLGKKLVQFGENLARERGFTSVELSARITAQIFYEKIGYTTSGDLFKEVGLQTIKMIKTL